MLLYCIKYYLLYNFNNLSSINIVSIKLKKLLVYKIINKNYFYFIKKYFYK